VVTKSAGSDPVEHEVQRLLRITQESVENAPIGVFYLDDEGRIVNVNRAATEALGYSKQELLCSTIFDIDTAFTRDAWTEHRARTMASGGRTLITEHRRKDGSVFPVEVTVKLFYFEEHMFAVSFAKDISERVQAEQERKRLEAKMLTAQKLESLGVLAGGIAHDFNNLLMVMIGNLDLAMSGMPSSAPDRHLLVDVDTAARQAAELCRQLLIYAGKGASRMSPVDLGQLLRAQAQMLEISASKSARLVFHLAQDLPQIMADRSQLQQVFMNLIINASDAIGEAPGVITLAVNAMSCDRDYLDAVAYGEGLQPGRYVFAEVTDTGCGMTGEIRERIFDPFFSTKTMGRGLGLAAVRGIIRGHGGGIKVYSEAGKGTTFKLLFPVPRSLDAVVMPQPATTPWRGEGVVLLVDDEEALRRLGRRMLLRLGFEPMVASNGSEAVHMYQAHRDIIRYVLLDWTMPEMSGGDTFVELRRIDPNVRVILTSGHAPEDVMRRLAGKPVTAFVRKPYNLEELMAAFRNASSAALTAANPSG
jgi:two-component system cell cycle sensor histidine kinase/response regulator CckA